MSTTDLTGATLFAIVLSVTAGALAAAPAVEGSEPVRFGFVETGEPGGDPLLRGVREAIETINASGGIEGRPLELVRASAPEPWRDGAMQTARLAFETDVIALIGPSDAEAAHVAAQIATKKRIPIVTSTSERTLTRARAPWVFSAVPDDGDQARALLLRAFEQPRGKTAVIVASSGTRGRRHAAGVERVCRELGVRILATLDDERGPWNDSARLASEADALLVWSEPEPALTFLRRLAAVGHGTPRILVRARLNDSTFLDAVPSSLSWVGVVTATYGERLGRDILCSLAAAARVNGAQPTAIRDGLLAGVGGDCEARLVFDEKGRRAGSVLVSLVRERVRQDGRQRPDMRGKP